MKTNGNLANKRVFTAYIEWDPETKLYVGTVPNIHGAHTQGVNMDELQQNLREVLELCLGEDNDLTTTDSTTITD